MLENLVEERSRCGVVGVLVSDGVGLRHFSESALQYFAVSGDDKDAAIDVKECLEIDQGCNHICGAASIQLVDEHDEPLTLVYVDRFGDQTLERLGELVVCLRGCLLDLDDR